MRHQFCVNLTTNHNIHREKNHVSQQGTNYASAVRKSVTNGFSSNLETSLLYPPWGHLTETVN